MSIYPSKFIKITFAIIFSLPMVSSICFAQEAEEIEVRYVDPCMTQYYIASDEVRFDRYAMMSAIPPEGPRKVEGADPSTFELIKCNFAKDKSHVYYMEKQIVGADAASFGKFEDENSSIFMRDHRYVYNRVGFRLENSDSKTFRALNTTYFCDQKQVYVYSYVFPDGELMKDIDPSSIELVGDIFLLSKGQIYRSGELVTDIDPYTYELLGNGYGRDKDNLFYAEVKIEGGDPATFEKLLKGKLKKNYIWVEESYCRDKNHIYLRGKILDGAIASEYNIPRESYLISNGNIFFRGDKLENADIASFEMLPPYNLAKDNNHVYYDNKIMIEADSKTFKHLYRHLAYDKENLYADDKIISKIDGESLTIMNEDHMVLKDNNYVYLTSRVAEPLLGKTKVDGKTLEEMKNKYYKGNDYIYYKDEDNVYYYRYGHFGNIKGANPTSFKFINPDLAIDDTGFYYKDKLVIKLDGKSFHQYDKNSTICKDNNFLYYFDTSDFYSLASKMKVDGRNLVQLSHSFYKDKEHVYYLSNDKFKKLKNADVGTFQVTSGNAGKDKNHYYINGEIDKN